MYLEKYQLYFSTEGKTALRKGTEPPTPYLRDWIVQ